MTIYTAGDITGAELLEAAGGLPIARRQILPVYCAFDIETTSTIKDGKKTAFMYIWQFGINGRAVIFGRSWDEYEKFLIKIIAVYQINRRRRLLVYIHNLAYEFAFIARRFSWANILSIEERRPISAREIRGIEYRCSYILSGYTLKKTAEQLTRHKIRKLTGELDYSKIRHGGTPLSRNELNYCINDVLIICAYIEEQAEEYKGIEKIPYTNTGRTRQYIRRETLQTPEGKKNFSYIRFIRELNINSLEEFYTMRRAFAGGYCHANAEYIGDEITGVKSYDIASSYPAVICAEKYPVSRGVKIPRLKDAEQFNYYINKYLCLIDIELIEIRPRRGAPDTPLQADKCYIKNNCVLNNGRIVSAARVCVCLTNIDYNIIKDFYSWESARIISIWAYKAGYLPHELITAVLNLYQKKTQLKGIPAKRAEYQNAKGLLNSVYGMCVTNPLRVKYLYDGEKWTHEAPEEDEANQIIAKYNRSYKRALFYVWGVFITAHARARLFEAIKAAGNNFIYADTDSVKMKDDGNTAGIFHGLNEKIHKKNEAAAKYYGIDAALFAPRTAAGKIKELGIWEPDAEYIRFKTLGAKRYAYQEAGGRYGLTVSGLNPEAGARYLFKTYGAAGYFAAFDNFLYIPKDETGKMLLTYIDREQRGEVTDYLGTRGTYEEKSAVFMDAADYTLNLSIQFINFLRGRRTIEK